MPTLGTQVKELTEALAAMTQERDELSVQLAEAIEATAKLAEVSGQYDELAEKHAETLENLEALTKSHQQAIDELAEAYVEKAALQERVEDFEAELDDVMDDAEEEVESVKASFVEKMANPAYNDANTEGEPEAADISAEGEVVDILEQYAAITDPIRKQAFFRENKDAIIAADVQARKQAERE